MLVRAFSAMAAASLIVAGGALGFMASDRDVPIETISSEVLTTRVRPGDFLQRRLKIRQNKRCYIHGQRVLYDAQGTRFVLEPLEFRAGIGTSNGDIMEYTVRLPIPHDAAFGPARIEISTVYQCNILHWAWPIYADTTVPFEIVPL